MQLSGLQGWGADSWLQLNIWRSLSFWIGPVFLVGRCSGVCVMIGHTVGARLHPPGSDYLLMNGVCDVSWTSHKCQLWSEAFSALKCQDVTLWATLKTCNWAFLLHIFVCVSTDFLHFEVLHSVVHCDIKPHALMEVIEELQIPPPPGLVHCVPKNI